ncbi:uncharacterized protein LOC128243866 [Mya arenaria]|uniref:uncharacterized protein LOC128243866 n=1 Tax=Mya arenaria TaxID=6604 RepID=UPI0022E1A52D|nr:uncharacterized protein LOC128243866 [Mya arenaria]XP_052817806.1 uncharacterized protein LOC128243866 [Mya arenaria]
MASKDEPRNKENGDILRKSVSEEPKSYFRWELCLIILFVLCTFFHIAAIVTPGWKIVSVAAGNSSNVTAWTSVYYVTSCVEASNRSECESKTALQTHIETYLKSTDEVEKASLDRDYNLTVRGQVDVQVAFILVVVCFIVCVVRCTRNGHHIRATLVCVILMTVACILMYHKIYEVCVQLAYVTSYTSSVGGHVQLPYSLIIYIIAFLQTIAILVIVVCLFFRVVREIQGTVVTYRKREKSLEEEVRYLRWCLKKRDSRNSDRRPTPRDRRPRVQSDNNEPPPKKITVDELLSRSHSVSAPRQKTSSDITPLVKEFGVNTETQTEVRDESVVTKKDDADNVKRSRSFNATYATENEKGVRYPNRAHSSNTLPRNVRPFNYMDPASGDAKVNETPKWRDTQRATDYTYDTVPRTKKQQKENATVTSMTPPDKDGDRFSLETLDLYSLSPTKSPALGVNGIKNVGPQAKSNPKIDKNLNDMKKTLAETQSILNQLRQKRDSHKSHLSPNKQDKDDEDYVLEIKPLLPQGQGPRSPTTPTSERNIKQNYARNNKPVSVKNLLFVEGDGTADTAKLVRGHAIWGYRDDQDYDTPKSPASRVPIPKRRGVRMNET